MTYDIKISRKCYIIEIESDRIFHINVTILFPIAIFPFALATDHWTCGNNPRAPNGALSGSGVCNHWVNGNIVATQRCSGVNQINRTSHVLILITVVGQAQTIMVALLLRTVAHLLPIMGICTVVPFLIKDV
ncbi:uncharacterized protein SETTUDRAFT_33465 [Exserohilum turcica Et28A]|uniref:Uncharacterized protein n=1 Tax=Exserohilum turcicum (strain 28A) TaxID=671987 RepID=R0JPS1_EXST2|nr:uncharacterized protein SETTUDRAFT_33465 [Exserohilum turcica Et28A]EOA83143.1 hypothetical protein SETTUDRAFT_33465 [Exserohilum turcica Et28A]